ncbi:short-chain dehydrogenase reductase sdr [Seiridium cupressi]
MTRHLQVGDDGPEEARPLLAPPVETWDGSHKTPITSSHRTRCTWPWVYVVIGCILLAVVNDVGEYLYTAPRIRLFESVACARYYLQYDPSVVDPDGSVPERLCKINPVQDETASILGWQSFFDSIPAILLPLPYGYLADKYGRKWILVLALLGFTLTWVSTLIIVGVLHWPLQYVWLSSIFHIIGGGSAVGTTMITTIVADVVPSELRSTVFFYRFCADLIAEFFVPPVTAILMKKSVWVPLLLAVGCQGLTLILVLFLPETLPLPVPHEAKSDTSSTSLTASSYSVTDEQPLLDREWKVWFQRTKASYDFVTRDVAVAALVFTFLVSKVGRQASNILLQYVSKRYGWNLAEAGLILSLRAGVNIALFTVVLPAIVNFVLWRMNAASRDLRIAQASALLMTVGAIIMSSSVTAASMIMGKPVPTKILPNPILFYILERYTCSHFLFDFLLITHHIPSFGTMAVRTGTLLVIGVGPGIGRAVASTFASKRYHNVALFARRSDQLSVEKQALEEAVGHELDVKTYALDVTDKDALLKALDDVDATLGKPECVFYNAARVLPSQLLTHDVEEIEYDFKINVSALYIIAQRVIPQLIEIAKTDSMAKPGLIVTSSLLPQNPIPQVFALSLVKAAQRNLMQSLSMTYASTGVHFGLVNVGGPVTPEHETLNPTNIASKAWEWFSLPREDQTFEVLISE